MSDLEVVKATLKVTLEEVSRQAHALGIGLQNAAPANKKTSNNSINYLLSISELLDDYAKQCDQFTF